MPLPEALSFIRSGEGTVFDPRVVAALLGAYQRGKLPS
jgi:HD-GYP domain-containing protein (c-di-GMP phosphodiesterase class II)